VVLNTETAYDSLATSYDSEYQSDLNRAEETELKRLLDDRIHTAGRIVDAGCGTGLLLDLFPSIPNYMGFDVSQGMLHKFKEKHPGRVVQHMDAWDGYHDPAAHVVSLFGSPSYNPIADVIAGVRDHLGYKPNGSTHRHGYGGRFTLMPLARGRMRTAWKRTTGAAIHSNLWYLYEARQWRQYLQGAGARDVVVRGFNLLGSKRLLRLEAPLARRFPDRCQYLFITGVM
jgi:SAM-dependent methyltransferase